MTRERRPRRGARREQTERARRGWLRFRRLVDAWRDDRRERTPMRHGTRVASIEAVLGGDMTPGRQARWERLEVPEPADTNIDHAEPADRGVAHGAGPDDPGLAYEDALFRAALDDVVPADTPDRDALIERALDAARERFLAHGEQTWPQEALDLLDQQPIQDQPQDVEHDDRESAMTDEQPDEQPDQQPDDAEYLAAEERDEVAREERVASLAAAMSTERARSIMADPSWHDERYDGTGDYDALCAARTVCEREGIDHHAMTDRIERYFDGAELDDPYSDEAAADIRRAGEPRIYNLREPFDREDEPPEHEPTEPTDEEVEP